MEKLLMHSLRGILLLVVALALNTTASGQKVELVNDFSTQGTGSDPSTGVFYNGYYYFAATHQTTGREIWRTDKTDTGTVLFYDIHPQYYSANPSDFIVFNNELYFVANDGVHGRELWKTDGTASGTAMVKDINPYGDGAIGELVEYNSTLYFIATDSLHGVEVWKTDGSFAGTSMLVDINPAGASNPTHLTASSIGLIFSADDGVHSQEPWLSDGTPSGTSLIKDINPSVDSKPNYFTEINGTIFFAAVDAGFETDLWKTNGTNSGTVIVSSLPSLPKHLVEFNGSLYFSAVHPIYGRELWRSEGTDITTFALTNDNTMAFSQELVAADNYLYFIGYDDVHGLEIWRSNGTSMHTSLLLDLNVGLNVNHMIHNLTAKDSLLFFSSSFPNTAGLYKTNGLISETVQIREDLQISNITSSNNELYISGSLETYFDQEIWYSDGTSGGTYLIKDINTEGTAPTRALASLNDTLIIFTTEHKIYKVSGDTNTTKFITQLSSEGHGFFELLEFNGQLFFNYDSTLNTISSPTLWRTDGTESGTFDLIDNNYNFHIGTNPKELCIYANELYFIANNSGPDLWTTDGSISGTFPHDSIYWNSSSFFRLAELAESGSNLFLSSDAKLHKYDGDTIVVLKDFSFDPAAWLGPIPLKLTDVAGILYFTADEGVLGRELWRSNGTEVGTYIVADINNASAGSYPSELFDFNGQCIFSANDGINGRELWMSDGTATTIVKDIHPTDSSDPRGFILYKGLVYFSADNGSHGRELWRTDGTSAGTVMIRDIHKNGSSDPTNFVVYKNILYFTATDESGGRELWRSDGSAQGTVRVYDIHPYDDSNPDKLTIAGNKLYFGARDHIHGREPWKASPFKQIFVDSAAASGKNNGLNWANAFTDINHAFRIYLPGDSIFVAKGTYLPDTSLLSNYRTATFYLPDSTIIIGGFNPSAGDSTLSSRKPHINKTILSGDIGTTSDSSDNCYHVLTANRIENTILDGFYIQDGLSTHATESTDQRGGGLILKHSKLIVNNCVFRKNSSSLDGHAIATIGAASDLALTNCLFHDQYSTDSSNHTLYAYNDNLTTITNCTFTENVGCAYSDIGGDYDINNSIIWNNGTGAPLELGSFLPGTFTVSHSLIEGGYTGMGNMDTIPYFTDTLVDDYTLLPQSPAINSGDNAANQGQNIDLQNTKRIVEGIIDMGAYEFQACNFESASVIYVDDSASGNNDGTSWVDAFTSLDSALLSLGWCGDTILVAEGTYIPSMHPQNHTDAGRDNAFYIHPNSTLIGGFPSGGSDFTQRDPDLFQTILSAEVGLPDSSDNLYHIILAIRDTNFYAYEKSTIDGFVLTRANVDNLSQPNEYMFGHAVSRFFGGAIVMLEGALELRNCHIMQNYGVGSSAGYVGKQSDFKATNCTFSDNRASFTGATLDINNGNLCLTDCLLSNNISYGSDAGAVKVSNSGNPQNAAEFTRCRFDQNTQSGSSTGSLSKGGGAIKLASTASKFVDCIFSNNSSLNTGGAIWHQSDPMLIYNCVFYNNTAYNGGAIYSRGDIVKPIAKVFNSTFEGNSASNLANGIYVRPYYDLSITNSIFRDGGNEFNTDGDFYITYSNIQGGFTGSGNIDVDPQFVDTANHNYRLQLTSPCINAGINDSIPSSILYDLDGNLRINDTTVDMGAYEYLINCVHPDYTALEAFYNATTGANWTTNTGWLSDCDPCNWHGITCDGNGRVTAIELQVNNLQGNLPPEIAQLTELIDLKLGVNNLTGPIPNGLDELNNLKNLWLQNNNFLGNIPYDLYDSPSLQRLYLNNNPNLSGSLQAGLGDMATLIVLRLHNTNIASCYPSNLINLCDQLGSFSTNSNISDNTSLIADWEDFCACNAGICYCTDVNVWQGGVGNWDIPSNWSLGHVPRACETVQIMTSGDEVTVPTGYYPVVYLIEVNSNAELNVPAGQKIGVLADPDFSGWTECE